MSDGRRALLDRYGRFYGAEHFAVTFTVGTSGDDAKRVTRRGWDKCKPLPGSEFGAGLLTKHGETHNVAVVVRPSNLVVIECDSEPDLDAVVALDLPQTLTVRSSEPYKRHFYFRPPEDLGTLPYVAFRFEAGNVTADAGRYFLAPPSIHPSGVLYGFLPGLGPGETDIVELPEHIYRQLVERARRDDDDLRERIAVDSEAKIEAGKRREMVFRFASMQRRWGTSRESILRAALDFNRERCKPPVPDEWVAAQVEGAMKMKGEQELPKQPPPELAGDDIPPELLGGSTQPAGSADPTATFVEFVARKGETKPAIVTSEQGTMVPAGGLVILAAKTGDGKTTLTVEFVQHACAGRDYLGLSFPRALRVLVIENEGPREAFREKLEARLAHWEHGGAPRIWDVPADWGAMRISDARLRAQLRETIEQHRIDLVVSDSLTRFGVRGNGTPEETREFVEWLTELGLGRDVAFLLLHHPRTRSDPGEDDLERIAGAWPPHADLILLLRKLAGARARLSFPKTRWTNAERLASILSFDPTTASFIYVSDDVPVERDYAAEIEALMKTSVQEWWTVTELRKKKSEGGIGADHEPVKQALQDERFESVRGDEIGKRKDWTLYRLKRRRPADDGHDATTLRPEGEEASASSSVRRGSDDDASLGHDASRPDDAPVRCRICADSRPCSFEQCPLREVDS